MPRSAIILTRSRELSLNVRYHRTHRTIISWSKCRPLKSSCAEAGSVIQSVTAGSRAFQVCTRTARLARAEWYRFKGSHQFPDVVAVAALNRKAEGLKLLIHWRELADVLCGAGDLQPVAVDNGNKVIQPVMCRHHGRLPVGA